MRLNLWFISDSSSFSSISNGRGSLRQSWGPHPGIHEKGNIRPSGNAVNSADYLTCRWSGAA